MGVCFSGFTCKDLRILLFGLEEVGKTTILYKIKLGEVVNTIHTRGFNVETVEYENTAFTIWDVGSNQLHSPIWRHYIQNSKGIVYVVDSTDRNRISDAHQELQQILSEEELYGLPLLVLANKQDLSGRMNIAEITDNLGLHLLRDRCWCILETSAVRNVGLYEGLQWLSRNCDS